MGTESVLKMSENFHVLTQLSAQKHFTELGYKLGDEIVIQLVQWQGLQNILSLVPY
jgi:hypothetical protein